MKCPKCHTENLDDSKFCKECATPFPGAAGIIPTRTLKTPVKGLIPGTIVAEKYRIIEVLGRGGMGVVYKAEDIKLKRTTALKFLAPELTREEEAKERFILEAQTASALSHPNICTVHEIGESDGQMFIAMAFVEGQSLRERIIQGPFKLDEAIDMGTQIAAGLHEAHEKGIVHRDVKSSNIMITAKGQAVIMDFGIAKLAGETKITRTGTTMGTVAYMSPEQARGEKVDHRTDIWSLGVVLYEMIIGQLPFKGEHEQAVMYSILNEHPEPMTALRTGVPLELERIVSKALQKDTSIRHQNAVDVLVDLKYLKENLTAFLKSPIVSKPTLREPKQKRWKQLLPWGITILAILLAFVFQSKLARQSSSGGENVIRFKREFPSEFILRTASGPRILLSPDGTSIISYLYKGGLRQLYTQKLNAFDFLPISGTEGAADHFFSPDGRWIGFEADRKMKKIGLEGGLPATVAEFAYAGASWGENDIIIYGGDPGLFSVPASGGEPKKITEVDTEKGEIYHRWPEFLPGSNAVIFTIWKGDLATASIGLVNLKTGETRTLIESGTNPHYAHSGHIVFGGVEGALLAVAFDLEKLEITGPVFQILEDLLIYSTGAAHFTLSRDGDLAYLTGTLASEMTLVNHSGVELFSSDERNYRDPKFSPDGQRVAVRIHDGKKGDIFIYSFKDGTFQRLTYEGSNGYPTWTPDGQRVAFYSNREGEVNLFWKKADGSSEAEPILIAENGQYEISFTSDGKRLAYKEVHPDTGEDLWILTLSEERKPEPFLVTPSKEMMPIISPDDRFIAYVSNESGINEVYVRAFPDPGGAKHQISEGGGREPLWSNDGRKLFYRSGGGEIISVAVETYPVFKKGKSEVLFGDNYIWYANHQNYDIHPVSGQFLMLRNVGSGGITVVLNWIEELKRLVPTEK